LNRVSLLKHVSFLEQCSQINDRCGTAANNAQPPGSFRSGSKGYGCFDKECALAANFPAPPRTFRNRRKRYPAIGQECANVANNAEALRSFRSLL